MITNIYNNKGGKLQKLLILILLTSLLLLVLIEINSAENTTETDADLIVSEEIVEEEIEIIEEETSIPEENIIENLSETNTQNETIVTEVPSENETLEVSNITNQTPSEPAETTSQSSGSAPESGIDENEEIKVPELDIEISHVNQITRGISTELVVIVKNIGDFQAENVSLTWILPSEFNIISGALEKNIGNILPGNSITSGIELQTTYSTSLGINEIKLKVNYENA